MRRDFGTTCTQKGIAVRRSLSVRSCFGAWCTNSYTSEKTTSNGEFIRTDTRATKSLVGNHYTQAQGRSMVEMLGVLAIIGVLSVGAIAGYSKAMFKYKLNKQTEQINQLFNGITQYYRQLSNTENLLPVLKKLNIVPVEMLKNNPSYIFDVFNNRLIASVAPCYAHNHDTCTVLYYHITINNNQDIAVCRNIINTVKENSSDLYVVELLGNWGQEGETQYLFSGDAYCSKLGRKCLKEISIYDMEDMCNSAKGKNNTHLKVWWRY